MNDALAPRILLIDDAKEIHSLVDRYLQGTGIQLEHAMTSADGIMHASGKDVDLILLDYDLPDVNGLDTLRSLRKLSSRRHTPVVFLTSNDDQKLIADAFAEGAVDFLRKPIYPMEFQARIKSVLKTQAMLHRLRYLSHNDPLTGLPNRNGMCSWIHQAADQPEGYPTPYAALVIGIDRISNITDLMGYGASEELMRAVAKRLQAILSQSSLLDRCCNRYFLSRGMCDDFIVLMTGIEGVRNVMGVAANVIESLASGYRIGAEQQFVSASVGVAVAREELSDFHNLIRCADLAFQDARKAGRSHVQLYEPSMEDVLRRKLSLENDLRLATKNKAFRLQFQPIFNLNTQSFDSAETIICWPHAESGEVPMHCFRPIAEENGLMGEISGWALNNACNQLSQWTYEAPSDAPRRISLDVSRKQLLHPHFYEAAIEAIQQARLRNDRVQFEISEAELLHDSTPILEAMRKLKESGIRIVVDDFGANFPSFEYLYHFPVDGIKLTRLLSQDIESNPYLSKLLEMIAQQAKELNLTVVVDGVERESQAKALSSLGFRWAQGDWYSKPLNADDLIPFLTHWNGNYRNKARPKPQTRDLAGPMPA